jgi:hypothetical protein
MGSGQHGRRRALPATWWHWLALAAIFVVGAWLRIGATDFGRGIVSGDETIYWYSAGDLLEHRTLTREIDGAMYRGEAPMEPTSKLSPGYPVFIAAIRAAGGGVPAVFASNVVLSLATLALLFLLMRELRLSPAATLLALLLAALYPGFVYNLDRMLTEQLYVALFVGFAFAAVRGMRLDAPGWTCAAAALMALAVHVRAQAIPFAAIAAVFLYATLPAPRANRHLLAFAAVLVALMLPWWVRNALTFGRPILLTDAGESAAVVGAVPYFIDMGSAHDTLAHVVARNLPPAPDVYYRWRVFGFMQYLWGDLWDERLAHPVRALRKLLMLHPLVVLPSLALAPLLALRRQPLVLFAACVPMTVSLLAAPFHGLPRYAFPAVPFAFVILAALLSWRMPAADGAALAPWQRRLGQWIARGFLVASLAFSLLLAYSVVAFAPKIAAEQSDYRLARYLGTRIDRLGTPAMATRIDLRDLPVENASVIRPGRVVNDVDAPPIIHVPVPRLGGGGRIVTEVTLAIHGGYPYDYTTIYWTGARTPSISEDAVYKVPNNAWRRGVTVYIDDDVDGLMVVPFVFRWSKMDLDSVLVRKYRLPPR